jgi:hypothetical protein
MTPAELLTEEEIQGLICEYAALLKYEVLITSRRRKRCVHCKKYSSGGDGVSEGLADLLIWHKRWGVAGWLGIEVKGPKTVVSPEQKRLNDLGANVIVRSLEEFQAALAAHEDRMTVKIGVETAGRSLAESIGALKL